MAPSMAFSLIAHDKAIKYHRVGIEFAMPRRREPATRLQARAFFTAARQGNNARKIAALLDAAATIGSASPHRPIYVI